MWPWKEATEQDKENAYQIGEYCAKQGYITLTGGRNEGVMNEALRGAKNAWGTTLGILPSDDVFTFSEYMDIPIITNMRSGRNYMNVLSSTIVIACWMWSWTSSEVSLALSAEKKVILVWVFEEANSFYSKLSPEWISVAKDAVEAIELLNNILNAEK